MIICTAKSRIVMRKTFRNLSENFKINNYLNYNTKFSQNVNNQYFAILFSIKEKNILKKLKTFVNSNLPQFGTVS